MGTTRALVAPAQTQHATPILEESATPGAGHLVRNLLAPAQTEHATRNTGYKTPLLPLP
jgi:hypothetical protein